MKQPIGPWILIIVGVLLLLPRLGINLHLGQFIMDWWPAALIIVGVLQLRRRS